MRASLCMWASSRHMAGVRDGRSVHLCIIETSTVSQHTRDHRLSRINCVVKCYTTLLLSIYETKIASKINTIRQRIEDIPGQLNCVQVILVHSVSSRDSQVCIFTHRWKGDVTRFKSIPNLMPCNVPNLSN